MPALPAEPRPPGLAEPVGVQPWARLLVGVICCSAGGKSLQRREAIRALTTTGSGATVRFVMGSDMQGDDKERGDVVFLAVPTEDARRTRKLFLRVHWFHRALRLHRSSFDFVAIADDDALFDAPAIASALAPYLGVRYVCYGPFQAWYLWSPTAMRPHCYGRNPSRFGQQLIRWRRSRSAAPAAGRAPFRYNGTVPEDARLNECFFGGDVGPFPFASGSFTAYSFPLVEALHATAELRDPKLLEAHVLSPGRMNHLDISPRAGRSNQSWPPAVTTVVVGLRVGRHIFLEDVYYMYLLFRHFGAEALTLVAMPFSDWMARNPKRVFPGKQLYHKLKEPEYFSFFRNRSDLLPVTERDPGLGARYALNRTDPEAAHPGAQPKRKRWNCGAGRFGTNLAALTGQGRNWSLCSWLRHEGLARSQDNSSSMRGARVRVSG